MHARKGLNSHLKIGNMQVEVCASSLASAQAGEQSGADRIELCSELAVGGITPSLGLLEEVREHIRIPVHVLIRPRSGDFVYSDDEFGIMLRDIAACRRLGFEGIVSGCLQPDGTVDESRTRALVEASGDCHFTFHRAFDRTPDPMAALASLEALGVDTVLSSGQQNSAEAGLDLLVRLQQAATRIRIMPGAGIRPENAGRFKGKGFAFVHLSGLGPTGPQPAYSGPAMNSPGLLTEGVPPQTDPERVAALIRALKAG